MNWSLYSRYVGSVFGAPLAVEALLAFFLESTFLGIWIFGKGRVSTRVHLASIWLVSIGTMLSALFILAANAWMQHPVGYKVVGNRAVMTNFWAVMTNSTLIGSFLHVLFSALVTSTMLILGVSALAPLEGPARRARTPTGVLHLGQAGPRRRGGRHRRHDVLRRQPGEGHGAPAAHEDGRRRGDLQHPERCELLAAHHRRPLGQPDLPDPAPPHALGTGRQQLGRRGPGHQPDPGQGDREVRPGELQAHLVGHLLDLPDHGGLRDPHARPAGRGPVAHAPAAAGTVGLVPTGLDLRYSAPLHRQHDGLDLHRDGPPAMGRLRTAQDLPSRVAHRHRLRRDDAGRFHGHLQPAGRDRLRAHGPLRPR